MGSFFSKIFVRNPEGYQQLPKQNLSEVFYQVAIKKRSIQNEKDKNDKIIKCLQVSDFLSRPINYKVRNVQNGGDIYKKPLFIFCCENTFEARMTLYFSWIRMISPIFPILILGSPNKNNNKNQNWNTFQFDSNELKKLAYNSPNFSLKKIPLNFVYYSRDPTNQNAIIEYYTKRQNINLADYDGVKLVFVQDFPDRKECELLDSNKNPVFPGAWVNSEFIKNGIFMNSNPLVDSLFLPDYNTLMRINNLGNLKKIEEYLRFLMMHYSENIGKSKNFKNIKLPDNYFFNYQNMRQILIKKINNLKESEQKST